MKKKKDSKEVGRMERKGRYRNGKKGNEMDGIRNKRIKEEVKETEGNVRKRNERWSERLNLNKRKASLSNCKGLLSLLSSLLKTISSLLASQQLKS